MGAIWGIAGLALVDLFFTVPYCGLPRFYVAPVQLKYNN